MNNRWREIAVTCWEERLDGLQFDQEMFAELIVKECMEWCDAHATIDGSAQQIRNSIKNYFGVEE
jgi:hypothetical protein